MRARWLRRASSWVIPLLSARDVGLCSNASFSVIQRVAGVDRFKNVNIVMGHYKLLLSFISRFLTFLVYTCFLHDVVG